MEQPLTINSLSREKSFSFSLKAFLVRHWATVLLFFIVLFAIGSRLWDLGSRGLHHDESLHAVYSFELFDQGTYKHDPLMHGPVLFHLSALGFFLFGASDFTSRLVPAILGILIVWAPWKFRDVLGTKGALVTSGLLLISPTMLYYSRFIRHDIFFAAWTVMIVYGMYKYLDEGNDFHFYLMIAGWALAFSQKEVSFLLAMVLWLFWAGLLAYHYLRVQGRMALREMREWHLVVMFGGLLLPFTSALVLHLFAMDPPGGYNEATYKSFAFIQQAGSLTFALLLIGAAAASFFWHWKKVLISLAIFYAIFILFHTTLLTWPFGIGSGMVGALGYWIEQHDVQRGDQPWYYYLLLTPLYEFLPLLIGVTGSLIYIWRKEDGQIAPGHKASTYHLNAKAIWPIFNLWWFISIFVVLSYAGEKMPWLLTHIALPLAFLGGWVLGKVLDHVDWSLAATREGAAWYVLFTLSLIAFASLFTLIFLSHWPFTGTDEESLQRSTRWLFSLMLLLTASWGASRLSQKLGQATTRHLAVLTFSSLLALGTIRFAIIASFVNGDIPNEPMIYTQTSPDVPMIMRQIELISAQIAGDKNLKVAYDSSTSWPFQWYLRDYPNKFYFGASPDSYTDAIRDAAIVLSGPEHNNDQKVRQLLPNYIRHSYSMRPNFPEDYKNLRQVKEAQPDPNNPDEVIWVSTGEVSDNPLNLLANVWRIGQAQQARADFLDFLLNRRMANPLGDYPMWMYVKPEVAAEVWQYGVNVTALDPELIRDPFAEVIVEKSPAITIGQPSDFSSPKNVAFLPGGVLAIADSGNHRIRLMNPDGSLVNQFGSFGAQPGQFNEPWGIASAPDGTIYVADTWNHRIQHLDQEGNVLHIWGRNADTGGQLSEEGAFYGPRDVAIDADGNVYVTDTGNKRIQKFDAAGNFLAQFGGNGGAPGQFAEPVGITIAPDGTIYVADTWNRRIQSFSPDFTPQRQISLRAWDGQSITNKPYIAATNERIWITDPDASRIIELNTEGKPQQVWGLFGSGETGLNLPLGITFDGQILWVADSENQRIVGYEVQ